MVILYIVFLFPLAQGAYHKAEYGHFCSDSGTRITSVATCKDAAADLGLEWGQSWWGPWDFPGCLHTKDSRNKVYFNLSPQATNIPNNPNYAEICTEEVLDANPCDIRVRLDGRCGPNYLLPNGKPGQCFPKENPCCSNFGWCGDGEDYCNCPSCVNYSPQCTKLSGQGGNFTDSVRGDGRCGPVYPLNGYPGQCSPYVNPCCSNYGWCGHGERYCKCSSCVNYSPQCVNRAGLTCPSYNRNTEGKNLEDRRGEQVLIDIVSAEECSNKCRDETTCNFWTWHNEYAGISALECVLMSSYVFTAFDEYVISGLRTCNPGGDGDCSCPDTRMNARSLGAETLPQYNKTVKYVKRYPDALGNNLPINETYQPGQTNITIGYYLDSFECDNDTVPVSVDPGTDIIPWNQDWLKKHFVVNVTNCPGTHTIIASCDRTLSTVKKVAKNDFDDCTNLWTKGTPEIYGLLVDTSKPGTYYFADGKKIENENYCNLGWKIAINVVVC